MRGSNAVDRLRGIRICVSARLLGAPYRANRIDFCWTGTAARSLKRWKRRLEGDDTYQLVVRVNGRTSLTSRVH